MFNLDEKNVTLFKNTLELTNDFLEAPALNRVFKMLGRYEKGDSDDDGLAFLLEILSLTNEKIDLDQVSKSVAAIKRHQQFGFSEKKEYLIDMLALLDSKIDLEYFSRLLNIIESDDDITNLMDSLSENQFKSKLPLLDLVKAHAILDKDSTVVIWGCWYGSILIPYLQKRVKSVIGIDLDDEVIRLAKNKLFFDYSNVRLITDDVFAKYRDFYLETNLIINTACEHMPPMKDWKWFQHGAMASDPDYSNEEKEKDPTKFRFFKTPKLSPNCHFVFQSNNMFGIPGHTNCVNSLDEFKNQMPKRAEVIFEEQIEEDRGIRFMLFGKFN